LLHTLATIIINKNHGDVMVSTWYVEHSKQVVDE